MKINIIKLGTIVTDTATGRDGMLTLMQIAQDLAQDYYFQPCGLNSETGGPVKAYWLKAPRLAKILTENIDLPVEVLGTIVTEIATGFTGRAINLMMHNTGCVHIDIQPTGCLAKNGASIESHNFSIMRLTGPAIPVLSPAEQQAERSARPSPGEHTRCGPQDPV